MNTKLHRFAVRRWATVWCDDARTVIILEEYGEREAHRSLVRPDVFAEFMVEFDRPDFDLGEARRRLLTGLSTTDFRGMCLEFASRCDSPGMDAVRLECELDRCQAGFSGFLASLPNHYGVSDSLGYVLSQFAAFIRKKGDGGNWSRISAFIDEHVRGVNSPLEIAICNDLLETLAEKGHPLEPFLPFRARNHWDGFT